MSNIAWESFKTQTMLADFDTVERRLSVLGDDDDDGDGKTCNREYLENNRYDDGARRVELVRFSSRVQRLLQIDVFATEYQQSRSHSQVVC